MSEIDELRDAIRDFRESISNFPVGAVSLDDFKPTKEKINDSRKWLKQLNAKLLMLKARQKFQSTSEEPEKDARSTVESLQDAITQSYLTEAAIKLAVHSYTIQDILQRKEGASDIQEKIYNCMHQLFVINDSIISVQKETEEALKQRLDLKIECKNALYDYKNFLKEQEELYNKRLQETNPQVARDKEKTKKTIERINIMKKLIVNFVAAGRHMLMKSSFMEKMLEDHRNLINMDTIMEMAQKPESPSPDTQS